MEINPELVQMAEWRIAQLQKQAFVPPGDPSQQGQDPSQMGGDPSQQGQDPSQMQAPPMDPSQGQGAVPGGGGMTADSIAQIVSQTMMQQQNAQGGGAGGNKPVKASLETVAIDIFQVKKMLQYLFNTMGIQLPPDILDGPNRDPSTGMPMPPGAPGSTSDPQVTAQNAAQQPQQGGQQGGIQPMQPMQPQVQGEKSSQDSSLYIGDSISDNVGFVQNINRASALSAIIRKLKH